MLSLLTRSGMVTGTRLAGALLTFATQMLLARILGPEGLGYFFIAISATAIASIVGCLGFPGTAARFIARYHARNRDRLKGHFARVTQRDVVLASSLIAAAVAGGAFALFEGDLALAISLAALAIPAHSILRLNGALALAGRRPWLSYVPDMLGRPLLFLLMLAGAYAAGLPLGLAEILLMSVAATFAPAAVQMAQVDRIYGGRLPWPHQSAPLRRAWRKASFPLVPVALLVGLFADLNLLLLSPLMEPAEIAVYGVALKLAFLAGFGIQASQQLVLPDLAEAVAHADDGGLRRALARTLIVSASISVAALIALAVVGPFVLGLFGPDYHAGYGPMLVLVAAQMARVPGAIAIQFLTLSGHQVRVLANLGLTSLVLAASSVALVPFWAATGAAWAVLLTMLTSSVIFVATAAVTFHRTPRARRAGQIPRPSLAPHRL